MNDNFAYSNSQEILLMLPSTPALVQNSEAYKKRICHISFEERSRRLVLQSIQETINELQKTVQG
jgi:hypothetical protein